MGSLFITIFRFALIAVVLFFSFFLWTTTHFHELVCLFDCLFHYAACMLVCFFSLFDICISYLFYLRFLNFCCLLFVVVFVARRGLVLCGFCALSMLCSTECYGILPRDMVYPCLFTAHPASCSHHPCFPSAWHMHAAIHNDRGAHKRQMSHSYICSFACIRV